MTLQYSGPMRTAQLTALANLISGGSLKIFDGTEPANTTVTDPANYLVSMTLPPNCLTAGSPAAGQTTLNGNWSGTGTSYAGSGKTAGFFRIYDSSGLCQIQGAIPGDMGLNNTSIAYNQSVSISSFNIQAGNQ